MDVEPASQGPIPEGSGRKPRPEGDLPPPPHAPDLTPEERAEMPTVIGISPTHVPGSVHKAATDTGRHHGALPEGTHFGRYRILRLLGEGGMGATYLAFDTYANRRVALKMLPHFRNGVFEKRFLREVRATAALDHPAIVKIFDTGIENGQRYYTMEFVDGETLVELIEREKRLELHRALEIVAQVADALHHAHTRGIIHRDIKPANIMIDREGQVRVTDFGVAKRLEEGATVLTHTGQIIGTPAYMSPEQAAGDKRAVDGRSDVYSLGCVLYQLFTGREPFKADTAIMMLKKVLDEDPIDPRRFCANIPQEAVAICMKAMEKRPERRYATAAEFADDVRRLLTGRSVHAHPTGVMGRLGRRARRYRGYIAAFGAIAVLLVAVVYLVHRMGYRERLFLLREQKGAPAPDGSDYPIPFLLRAAKNPHAVTRCYALTALARSQDRRAREAIAAAASDPDETVRLHVIGILDALPRDRMLAILSNLAEDPVRAVREEARKNLGRRSSR